MTGTEGTTGTTDANSATGAPSNEDVHWHSINWKATHANVKRLQARIAKAAQAGRQGKVKALQWILTHSFSAKAEAVKRVTENHGKNTPGVDKETWGTPAKKSEAIRRIGRRRGYAPSPLRRIYIPKTSNPKKLRPLSIPTMLDRAQQALHLFALDPVAETIHDRNSYGFRKERSPADAIEQCFKLLCRKSSPSFVAEGDIKSCFDEISHEFLLKHIPMDRLILRKWLKAGFIEKQSFHPTEAGTPQGGIISPVLANLTLDGMERLLRQEFPEGNKAQREAKIHLVRYADDFVITGTSKEVLEQKVIPLIETFLGERGLKLSTEKTVITHITAGFDFLGQNICKRQGKLLITPSRKNIDRLKAKVRKVLKEQPQATAGEIIAQLNPMLRGWANYHRHVVSSQIFNDVDNDIFKCLWRWALRRHPTRTKHWVKQTYFPKIETRDWVFTGQTETHAGKSHALHLVRLSKVPIKRHIKIRADANPYDPAWEGYFEARSYALAKNTLEGRIDLQILWQRQFGLCPVCHQALTPDSPWERHHVVWRVYGGSDTFDNIQLLHQNCHRQIHAVKGKP
ncbi:MAG: group II intron reverse transcriptase/maturase [Anaerolineae bacterium]|nr:group II intron reverse transcriptase/maturase [Anaerolineae bacterium]